MQWQALCHVRYCFYAFSESARHCLKRISYETIEFHLMKAHRFSLSASLFCADISYLITGNYMDHLL
jgi:hypothetical protein